MALNGWHRLGIVIAAAWALAMIGLTTLEYHGRQGEIGDGFFTCWEPGRAPNPPETRYWNRDCGILPRAWVSTGIFDDFSNSQRVLNTTRFFAVLLGPPGFIALCISAVSWIVSGFRPASSRTSYPEPNIPGIALPPVRPEFPAQSHAEAWLHRLPRRWAHNGAISGGLPVALMMLSFPSKSDDVFVTLLLVSVSLATLCSAGGWYLCGLWARYSLKAPFMLNPASALARITPNWLTGAILLGALVLACDVLFGWRKTTPMFEGGVGFRDWGYLIGFFGTWMLVGYLTALVSKRGLRKAIDADRKPSPARTRRPPMPHGDSRQREYSIG